MSSKAKKLIIYTDMDGTLLNHNDYQMDAALPLLDQLEEEGTPVILNTSKTFAELNKITQSLTIKHPFIVENGSAIFIPKGYFPANKIKKLNYPFQQENDFWVLRLGASIDELNQFCSNLHHDVVDFSTCSVSQAMALTGLSQEDAILAQTRLFTKPLSFNSKVPMKLFQDSLKDTDYQLVKGGRFYHLMGKVDKAKAMKILTSIFENLHDVKYINLSLGDSLNDEAMLQQSDMSVVVKSPSSHLLKLEHVCLYKASYPAPEGWVEGVIKMKEIFGEIYGR